MMSLVTGNHQIRAAGNRRCEDKVVVRIWGESCWREVGDNFANYFQTGKQVLRVFRRDVCTQVLTTQDDSQLAELRCGSDQRHAIVLECRQLDDPADRLVKATRSPEYWCQVRSARALATASSARDLGICGSETVPRCVPRPTRGFPRKLPAGPRDRQIGTGPLAQLAEQQTLNLRVRGSIPWRLTTSSMTRARLSPFMTRQPPRFSPFGTGSRRVDDESRKCSGRVGAPTGTLASGLLLQILKAGR